jgi:hypothetical protein
VLKKINNTLFFIIFLSIFSWGLLKEALSATAGRLAYPECLLAEHASSLNSTALNSIQSISEDEQSPLGLTIKDLNLSQGEGGVELWRLKAEEATMLENTGKIIVQQPSLTYYTSEKDKIFFVTSNRGIVDQKEQILSFIDNVQIRQGDKSILSNLLVYNGTVKSMTFPHGGNFRDKGVSGSASFLVWDLPYAIIKAEGEVFVNFLSSESPTAIPSKQEK